MRVLCADMRALGGPMIQEEFGNRWALYESKRTPLVHLESSRTRIFKIVRCGDCMRGGGPRKTRKTRNGRGGNRENTKKLKEERSKSHTGARRRGGRERRERGVRAAKGEGEWQP